MTGVGSSLESGRTSSVGPDRSELRKVQFGKPGVVFCAAQAFRLRTPISEEVPTRLSVPSQVLLGGASLTSVPEGSLRLGVAEVRLLGLDASGHAGEVVPSEVA